MRFTRNPVSMTIMGLLALALLAVGSVAAAMPNTLVRSEISDDDKWNLSDIYANWETWDKDLAEVKGLLEQYGTLRGTLGSGSAQLATALELGDQIGIMTDRLDLYASLMSVTDLRDNDLSARYQVVQNLYSEWSEVSAWFDPELLSVSWETVSDWLDEARLEPYRFMVEDLFRQKAHVLSEDKEKLLAYFGSFNSAPSSIYGEMSISDIQYPSFTLNNGDTIRLTETQSWYQMRLNPDQDERDRLFKEFYGAYTTYTNTYAAIYNSVLQRDWAMARARNYESTLRASLDADNIPTEVFQTLVTTVREGTAPLRRYHKLRKKALGLDHYYWSDTKAPIVDFAPTYEYDEVLPWILEAVKPLGDDYQQKMKLLLESPWVDVYENEGKYSGAFQADAFGVHPYMLMNFDGTMEEVFTLAHEAGHAVHSMYSLSTQPYASAYATIFVAEVPSTLNEALLLDYMVGRTDDPKERIALLQQAIDNIAGTFYLQVLFADFEWQAHKLVEEGQPITADVLRGIYGNLLTDYYGDAIEMDSLYHAYWTRISHFFDSPYYVYKYATCFAGSAQLVNEITAGEASRPDLALERYLTLLKSGGSDYPMAQLQQAGVDLTKPETLQAVVTQLDNLVSQLETELDRLN